MINSFHQLINYLHDDPDFVWLTIEHESGSKTFTYKELFLRISDYYNLYESFELEKNDIILIILKESLDLFASFLAGIIYGCMPAYFAYPSPKQSIAQFLKTVDDLVLFNNISFVLSYTDVVEIINENNQLDNSIIIDHKNVKQLRSDKAIVKNEENNSESFLQFSSGTTGSKKGVRITSEALFNQIDSYRAHLDLDNNSKIISWLPHYHDMGLISCMLIPVFEKIPIVMLSPFEWVKRPSILLENIMKHKATHTWQPNFALGHLVKSIPITKVEEYDLSSLKKLTCCSEPVLYETVNTFIKHFKKSKLDPNIIQNCYAMAENTFAMTVSKNNRLKHISVDYDLLKKENKISTNKNNGFIVTSVGIPIKNTKIKIVSEDLSPLEENQVGLILIKSNCLLKEYHNNLEATKESFIDGWFNTGDLGFINNNELYVNGRKKELIIVGGENIYPQDIEQILNAQSFLIKGRNVVFGIKDKKAGTEKIIALAEVDTNRINEIDLLSIKKIILNRLNISLSEILLLPSATLKKSTAGKISRYLNYIEFNKGNFDKYFIKISSLFSDKNDKYQKLINIVNEILPKRNNIIVDENTELFNSGLIDSFGFIELMTKIESLLNVQIPQNLRSFENFETVINISITLDKLMNIKLENFNDLNNTKKYLKSLDDLQSQNFITRSSTFTEKLINNFPLKKTKLFPWFLNSLGMKIGKNVKFLGNAKFKIRGKISNIIIHDNVILSRNIDIRNRENGKIIINKKCYIDENVRIVSARDGKVELGEGTEIGGGCIINSGGIFSTGKYCLIAGNVNINSSSHGTNNDKYIKIQNHEHGEIIIGDDVWVGASASILMNSWIGTGAIISSNSLVIGEVPDFSIFAGVPAKLIRKR